MVRWTSELSVEGSTSRMTRRMFSKALPATTVRRMRFRQSDSLLAVTPQP